MLQITNVTSIGHLKILPTRYKAGDSSDAAWASRRVLVTGAGGFVGRWLVAALHDRGAKVFAVTRNATAAVIKHSSEQGEAIAIISGDVTNLAGISQLIADELIDTVYHLAASNINTGNGISPYSVYETNLRGVYTVLEACRLSSEKPLAIIASSREVEDCFRAESSRRMHPYMTSKAAAELAARTYSDTFGLPVIIARSDNIYGGGDLNWARLIPNTIRTVLRGENPIIRSNGQLRRDYVYIEDVIAAYLAIGEKCRQPASPPKLFRISTGTSVSVLEIVHDIIKLAGHPELRPVILNENHDERVDVPYRPQLEFTALGWQSQSSLQAGLSHTIEWYRHFLETTSEKP
jgi:CDP-glucose 4,6-dehydratase